MAQVQILQRHMGAVIQAYGLGLDLHRPIGAVIQGSDLDWVQAYGL